MILNPPGKRLHAWTNDALLNIPELETAPSPPPHPLPLLYPFLLSEVSSDCG